MSTRSRTFKRFAALKFCGICHLDNVTFFQYVQILALSILMAQSRLRHFVSFKSLSEMHKFATYNTLKYYNSKNVATTLKSTAQA